MSDTSKSDRSDAAKRQKKWGGRSAGSPITGRSVCGRCKDAEDALQESESRLRAVTAAARNAIFMMDAHGIVTHCNPAVHRVLGYLPEELIGCNLHDLVASERYRPAHSRALPEFQRTGRGPAVGQTLELKAVHKDGRELDIELSLSSVAIKGEWHAVGIVRDITESRQLREDLGTTRIEIDKARAAFVWEQRGRQILMDNTRDGIAIIDQNHRLIEYNKSFARMLGYSMEEMSGLHTWDWDACLTEEDVRANFSDFTDLDSVFETRHRRKDGSEYDVEVSLSGTEIQGNKVIVAMCRDITARKRTDNLLAAQLRLIDYADRHSVVDVLRKTLDETEALTRSAIGFYHFVKDDQETLELQAWSTNTLHNLCATVPRSRHYPISQAGVWVDCVRRKKPVIHNDYAALSHTKGLPEGHVPLLRELVVPLLRDNKIVSILGVGNKDTDYTQEDIETVHTLADFTWEIINRKRAEEQLQHQQQLFELTGKVARIGGWEFDPVTGQGEWTAEVARIHDLDPAEKTSLTLGLSFYHGASRRKIHQAIKNAIEFGIPYDLQLEMTTATGAHKWVHTIGEPIVHDGKVVRLRGSFQDITEHKRAEENLRQRTAELEQFNYTVSHDLKSPLVTVKSFLGFLEQDLVQGNVQRIATDIHYIRTGIDRMGDLLDDLLHMSQLGWITNPSEKVFFRELLQEVLLLVGGPIVERGVKVTVAKDDLALYGDRSRLIEIWQNLLDNAVKYMGDQPSPQIDVGFEQGEGSPVFYVRDNGIGVDPRYAEKIFGLFEQLDRQHEGSGLGLALVKRIVELNGGNIWVESDGAGHGSCFNFTLPKAQMDSSRI